MFVIFQVYSIGLNTIFASVFPLLSLFYLNIYTVNGKKKKICSYVYKKERILDKVEIDLMIGVHWSDFYGGGKVQNLGN